MHPLYQKYYSDRDNEQRDLFAALHDRFAVRSFLYPGSFVHIAPSFVIPRGVYVDSDRQAAAFFKDIQARRSEIDRVKAYAAAVDIRFFAQGLPNPRFPWRTGRLIC